ncbi:hypothetical protein NEDG_00853 [Nematocida displodere]|uniref:Uncharacterized protein n=1 Tax=Nematocida displodere TaxID=1805483 RepID=A0A177EE78_9MICR|nr:hypothetical protein NEDG_00853 [Nematocida displodere]
MTTIPSIDREPREIYTDLCDRKQQTETPELLALAASIEQKLEGSRRKCNFFMYSMIEILRIIAPTNPFGESALEALFIYISRNAPAETAGQRALETIGSYKMIAVIDRPKTINALADAALAHLSKTWSVPLLEAIIEEKEEELGRETKNKIIRKIAEGSTHLDAFLEKNPFLFQKSVEEYVFGQAKGRVAYIKKFNEISKSVITETLVEKVVEDTQTKKDLIVFLKEATVRREILRVLVSLAEDRSSWVRIQIPLVLLKRSQDPFYTAAISSEIRSEAQEIWIRRTLDTSPLVRSGLVNATTAKDLSILGSEASSALVERLADIENEVRKAAIQLLGMEYLNLIEQAEKNSKMYPPDICFICRPKDKKMDNLLLILKSTWIPEFEYQKGLLRHFFSTLYNGQNTNPQSNPQRVISEMLLLQGYQAASLDTVEKLAIFKYTIPDLGLVLADHPTCSSHRGPIAILRDLAINKRPGMEHVTKETPIFLLVMMAEAYPSEEVPLELLATLKAALPRADDKDFYHIAHLITSAEYATGQGWTDVDTTNRRVKDYVTLKALATNEEDAASFDLSQIAPDTSRTEPDKSRALEPAQKEAMLSHAIKDNYEVAHMLLLDLWECHIRVSALEKAVMKYLFSKTYDQIAVLDWMPLFNNRLGLGLPKSLRPDISLLYVVVAFSCSRENASMFNPDHMRSIIPVLCWAFMENGISRASEIIMLICTVHPELFKDAFSVFINLLRFKVDDPEVQAEMYTLASAVSNALFVEARRLGNNPSQYDTGLPEGLYDRFKQLGGWSATLTLLDEDQFYSNILTYREKPKK